MSAGGPQGAGGSRVPMSPQVARRCHAGLLPSARRLAKQLEGVSRKNDKKQGGKLIDLLRGTLASRWE